MVPDDHPENGRKPARNVVGLCSRGPGKRSPEALLKAVRLHWTIENNVHGVRDVNWREDP